MDATGSTAAPTPNAAPPPAQASAAAAPAAENRSPMERMKAFLSASSDAPAADSGTVARPAQSEAASPAPEQASALTEDTQVPDAAPAAEDQGDASDDVQSSDAQSEDWQPSNLNELLAAAFGENSDKGFDLELPVKIDGKEGTAKLRDLVKSYQLDGHINQRLEAVNNDRKALEADRTKFQSERAEKIVALDAGLQVLERSLIGEFQQVDWKALADSDPTAYNAKYVAFQQRNAELQQIAQSIQAEKQQHQAQYEQAYNAYLAEQKKLLAAAVPEWSDEGRRSKDKAEMLGYLGEMGCADPEKAFGQITEAWQALVVRDALRYRQLQKSKPAVLNKVRAAPKLLKPGSQQSRAATNSFVANKERDRLKATGKGNDAIPLIKRAIFGS
jgi:hypothetical protein